MERSARLGSGLPPVRRLGLATRGGSRLQRRDVEHAIARGINYLNWCGHDDGLREAVAGLGRSRGDVVVALQLEARTAAKAARELARQLERLATGYVDVVTLYYVESQAEWDEIVAPGGALEYLERQKAEGVVRLVGLTTHQRKLAVAWGRTGKLDLLMVRYNAAHRGAEQDVFPAARELALPVVTFTGLRWRALLGPTPSDPDGFTPARAPDWYRFCLAHPGVTVALMAPGNRRELEENLTLLDDWRPPAEGEVERLRAHGDRVRRHAGAFW
jgi:predicted aldo/keto reductase-like oxidoreductase